MLQQLLDDTEPPFALVPMTTDCAAARAWLTGHLDAGIEGVVAKRLDQGYQPVRTAWWVKVKTRRSAEAIVGGVLGPLHAPVALVLGRPDDAGRLRVAGCTGPVPRASRREIGAMLRPASGRHPWPETLSPARWGRHRARRVLAGRADPRR